MKRMFLCFVFILVATLSRAAEEVFVHAETGISLPASMAGFERGPVQTYEAAPGEPGVAIPFHGADVEITVFIRAAKPGAQSTAQGIVDDSLKMTRELEKAGTYTHLKIFQGEHDPENPQWAKGAYMARARMACHSSHSFTARLKKVMP